MSTTQTPTRPSKLDNAINQARIKEQGGSAAAGESTAPLVPLPREAAAMLMKPTEDDIAKFMNDSEMEFAPQVHSLEEGEMIAGILEGRGPSTTFSQEDPFTRQTVTREVDTWIVAAPNGGMRLSILSSVQLDRKLPPCIGAYVRIFRGKDKKTLKGFRVTDYMVSVRKQEDGQSRSWVQKDVIDVQGKFIDAPDAPALPAAGASSPSVVGGEDVA
jgi:hypothetical protein